MSPEIKTGLKGLKEQVVTKHDSAKHYGSGVLAVYATPAMIALMENTCQESVGRYLPDGFSTVGTTINVQHIKATALGRIVRCESELYKIEGKRLYFKVIAYEANHKIGFGEHKRYMINNDQFLSKIKL